LIIPSLDLGGMKMAAADADADADADANALRCAAISASSPNHGSTATMFKFCPFSETLLEKASFESMR
jgi:hypothetical protein